MFTNDSDIWLAAFNAALAAGRTAPEIVAAADYAVDEHRKRFRYTGVMSSAAYAVREDGPLGEEEG